MATISTQMKREYFSLYLLSSDLAKVDKSAAISGLERTFARSSASTFVGSSTVFPATLACILGSISKWEKNVNSPNVIQFFALCEILGIDNINDTFGIAIEENLFAQLNEEGQKKRLNI